MRQSRDDPKAGPTAPAQIEALIVSLSKGVQLLDEEVEAEERRSRCRDCNDTAYSLLARNLRERRKNLSVTIGALQERRNALDVIEWNYS